MKITIKPMLHKEEDLDPEDIEFVGKRAFYLIKVIPETEEEKMELLECDHFDNSIDKKGNLRISFSE